MERKIKFREWDGKKMLAQERLLAMTNGRTLVVSLHMKDEAQVEDTYVERDYPLMQFTGLHDKNGKEIYEGDVVKIDGWSEPLQHVIFNRGGFCTIRLGEESASFAHDIKYAENGEVIGNIYENPELLKTN